VRIRTNRRIKITGNKMNLSPYDIADSSHIVSKEVKQSIDDIH